jgi:uncharacterized protein
MRFRTRSQVEVTVEHHFEIPTDGGVIRGMAHVPTEDSQTGKLIIVVHGYFSANRVGPARIYVQIARTLCDAGHIVYRADMLGVGDSDGHFSDITFERQCRDLHTVSEFAHAHHRGASIVYLGHSMGANLALKVATESNLVHRLILIAPDVEKLHGVDNLFDTKQLQELDDIGWTIRKGLFINASFVRELRSNHPYEHARALRIPIIVLQGDADELYSRDGARRLAEMAYSGSFAVIPKADHNFLDVDSRRALLEELTKTLQE